MDYVVVSRQKAKTPYQNCRYIEDSSDTENECEEKLEEPINKVAIYADVHF